MGFSRHMREVPVFRHLKEFTLKRVNPTVKGATKRLAIPVVTWRLECGTPVHTRIHVGFDLHRLGACHDR